MAKDKRELARWALSTAFMRTKLFADKEDARAFFASGAEILWWITTLDEAIRRTNREYEERRDADDGRRVIPGLRYVRDRLIHEAYATGMQGNPLLPDAAPPPWSWRPVDDPELPEFTPQSKRGQEVGLPVYQELLAETEIIKTLAVAVGFLEDVAAEL